MFTHNGESQNGCHDCFVCSSIFLKKTTSRSDSSMTSKTHKDMHTPSVWFFLCGWDHKPLCRPESTACVRLSLSVSGVYQGEAIPLLIVGSWSCTCHETHQETERGSLIAWQRALALSLICFFVFFLHVSRSLSLSCHILKVEPVEGNDKQTTQGGWGRERKEWVDGWR